MKFPLVDRRKAVRVRGEFSLELKNGKRVQVGKSVDLSVAGMCCEIDQKLPLFEEIEMSFQLPGSGKKEWVSCSGVVVRCVSEGRGKKCRAAFFFTECNDHSRRKIADYVKKSLALAAAA